MLSVKALARRGSGHRYTVADGFGKSRINFPSTQNMLCMAGHHFGLTPFNGCVRRDKPQFRNPHIGHRSTRATHIPPVERTHHDNPYIFL
jgi:hypothetical protein